MKSITIHNLGASVETLIEANARAEGLSLNKMVNLLLRRTLGLRPAGPTHTKAVFAEFSGLCSEAEKAEFDKNTKDRRLYDTITASDS